MEKKKRDLAAITDDIRNFTLEAIKNAVIERGEKSDDGSVVYEFSHTNGCAVLGGLFTEKYMLRVTPDGKTEYAEDTDEWREKMFCSYDFPLDDGTEIGDLPLRFVSVDDMPLADTITMSLIDILNVLRYSEEGL